ncbi:thiamine pyrophosphate-binding protein [Ramlibacter albus]|uniref:Thiamine pyrophosphate-binding protein n=1 Tax=Ramlibacter albus TaxID=2079448 RepID=A0A923S445_9BURK|nr:thiamine pyrophosphate-binding protein [Ramlibacter albus]MBC5767120.1 thiamine pyrophosphate-binding protein [Ramlibacter albus]
MTRPTRGADVLAASLRNAGVTRVFALSGNHVMSLFDALQDVGIAIVHTRHEAAAVHMAEGWARVSGQPGIALVTGGPGHANAVGALYTALMAESPVVLLSGHAPLRELGRGAFQEMAQAEMAAPVVKRAFTSERADALGRDFAAAVRTAMTWPRGPVNLNLPSDLLEEDCAADAAAGAREFAVRPKPLDGQLQSAFAQRLAAAKRPLVLAGAGFATRAGRAVARRFEQATGVPVLVMNSPRGLADPALGSLREVVAQADCILLAGKRLDFTLDFGRAFASGCEVLAFDADAPAALDAIAVGLRTSASQWQREVHDATTYRPAAWDAATSSLPGRLHPVQALRPLQSILDSHPDSVLVIDGGEFGQWAQACLHAPHLLVNGVAGSIGSALPMAIGARCAQPGAPVVAIMGDGTFGFHMAEYDTAVTNALPFAAVVGVDGRWNAEFQIQLRQYGAARAKGCEMRPLRYDLIAAAMGAHGEHVTAPPELLPAVQRALASGQPACVNVAIEGVAAPRVAR